MYVNEDNTLGEAKDVIRKSEEGGVVPLENYKKLMQEYETLLSEIKFITRISDRLQSRLSAINESLTQQAVELENAQHVIISQNEELRQSKDELEMKVAERTKELKQANDDLRISNLELDTFVYRASHDIKGPIASLMGLCNVALMDIEDDTVRNFFVMMLGIATQLQNKVNRLLDLNNLKHSQIHPQTFSIEQLIQECETGLRYDCDIITVEASDNLPLHIKVNIDLSIFKVMLDNLIEYAVRNSTNKGEPHRPYIKIKFSMDQQLWVHVSYKGDVIPAELYTEIFKMFYRTSNNPDLTGIELYTASLAAERLKGRVELYESSMEETVFCASISC